MLQKKNDIFRVALAQPMGIDRVTRVPPADRAALGAELYLAQADARNSPATAVLYVSELPGLEIRR